MRSAIPAKRHDDRITTVVSLLAEDGAVCHVSSVSGLRMPDEVLPLLRGHVFGTPTKLRLDYWYKWNSLDEPPQRCRDAVEGPLTGWPPPHAVPTASGWSMEDAA